MDLVSVAKKKSFTEFNIILGHCKKQGHEKLKKPSAFKNFLEAHSS